MAPWPFFSSAAAKIRTPPARASTPHSVDDDDSEDYFGDQHYLRDYVADTDGLDFNDLEPPAPPFAGSSRSRPHSRTLSNSLFGGKKKPPNADSQGASSPTLAEAQLDSPSSPRKQAAKSKAEEPELESGTCATCNSKMQWPRGVPEYRCSTCLMINDLKISERNISQGKDKEGISRSDTHPSTGSRSQVPPIDFEETKSLIDRCIDDFLDSRSNGHVGSYAKLIAPHSSSRVSSLQLPIPSHTATDDSKATDPSSISSPSRQFASDSNIINQSPSSSQPLPPSIGTPAKPSRDPPAPPPVTSTNQSKISVQRKPVPPSAPRSEGRKSTDLPTREERRSDETSNPAKAIFKPLEEYIIHTYANHECLNISFLLERPRARATVRSDEALQGRHRSHSPDRNQLTEAPLSELDAKTLLLGDIGENGLWWTGRDARAHSVGRRGKDAPLAYVTEIVHTRSPRINWQEVHSWYRLVLRAGEDWRQRRKLHQDRLGKLKSNMSELDPSEAADIDSAFIEARTHVQRTLLKTAEAILKRPGRPLKRPNDTRFLLILISNPLLYPASSSPMMSVIGKELASLKDSDSSRTARSQSVKHSRTASGKWVSTSFWDLGHAFGIIKRVLGLMSNLPDDCHKHLTTWLSRYHESHYRQFQGLVQSFITYRLARMQGRDKGNNDGALSGWKSDLFPATDGREARLASRLESIESGPMSRNTLDGGYVLPAYCNDWQIKAAARVMTLLFAANKNFHGQRISPVSEVEEHDPSSISRTNMKQRGQLLSTSEFYNLRTDYIDVTTDFAVWESSKNQFSFCQHPFLLSVGSKIRIMEFDSQRQMRVSAREACFENLFNNKALQQHLVLKVRRECLIEDSLSGISEVVAQGFREFKKALKVQFVDEPGVDAGGLKKEWFLLLVREIFDPDHGMFIYDEESRLCYFNPHSFETSDQFFLVGALIGFAIYNLTILDVALPPFLFKRLLAPSNPTNAAKSAFLFGHHRYSLDDLAEYRPSLAKGLKQLLEYDGDVEETYCRDFVIEVERYGSVEQVPLVPNGTNMAVTNSNRKEFVDLYIQYLLETQVSRQFEPFKRGFNMVCGGNAISLFQPEEIELLIRGSDEPLDVSTLKSVATYAGWRREDQEVKDPAAEVDLIRWFWQFVDKADPKAQRRLLSFITGSDRIPATGASNLVIKIVYAGADYSRFPVARTCFNQIHLYKYRSKEELAGKLWRAVCDSEGFGLR